MAEPIIGPEGEVWCPEPDCDRGPGGKPFASRIAYMGHERKHEAEARRAREAAERLAAAEAGEPIPGRRARSTGAKGAPLEARLAASLGAIGGGVALFPLFPTPIRADGRSLVNHAEPIAKAAVDLGAENETVRKVCELLAGGGAWGAFVVVFFSFMMEVAANHGWVRVEVPAGAGAGDIDPAAMAAAMGIPPEVIAQMSAMAEQMAARARPPLQPEGADPGLTGAAFTTPPMGGAAAA